MSEENQNNESIEKDVEIKEQLSETEQTKQELE